MTAGVWIIAATLLIGLVLLAIGLRGRRVGDEPRCRKCKYNLTGIELDQRPDGPPPRCPECGAALSERRAIRNGLRKRGVGFVVVGGMLTALGAFAVIVPTQVTGWMPRLPNSAIFLLVRLGHQQATEQLCLRCFRGALEPGEESKAFAALLSQFGQAQHPVTTNAMVEMAMDDFALSGTLTAEEVEAWWNVRPLAWLWFRKTVRCSEDIVIEVSAQAGFMMPRQVAFAELSPGVLTLSGRDGTVLARHPEKEDGSPSSSVSFHLSAGTLEPGRFELTYRGTAKVSTFSEDGRRRPFLDREVVLHGTLLVVRADEDPVRRVKDPKLEPAFRASLAFSCEASPSLSPGSEYLVLYATRRTAVGQSGAFEVLAEIDGTEVPFGGMVTSAFTPTRRTVGGATIPLGHATHLVPILRSSTDVARRYNSAFIDEIWDGEIRFDPIPIERPASADDASSQPASASP